MVYALDVDVLDTGCGRANDRNRVLNLPTTHILLKQIVSHRSESTSSGQYCCGVHVQSLCNCRRIHWFAWSRSCMLFGEDNPPLTWNTTALPYTTVVSWSSPGARCWQNNTCFEQVKLRPEWPFCLCYRVCIQARKGSLLLWRLRGRDGASKSMHVLLAGIVD